MNLSIAMMVKNEETNLERCLQSLQPIRDAVASELIIVDTGSTDKTVEIANKYTNMVYFHAWNNDFSAMRNITISYAKGKWILIIDADEEIEKVQTLINFLQMPQSKQYAAVAINCKNIVDPNHVGGFSLMTSYRLFKNDGYFHYEGAVHNQAVYKGKEIVLPEVLLVHYGYIATDAELMERKFLRTSAILKSELEKEPNNYYYWTQLSTTYSMHNQYEMAIEYAEKAYALLPAKKMPQHLFAFIQMIICYQHIKNYEKVETICTEALSIKEGNIDIYYYLAEAKAVLKKYKEAIKYYQKYLETVQKHHDAMEKDLSVIEYTVGLEELVYYNLSNLCKITEENELALQYAEKITNEKYFEENIGTVIILYIKLGRYIELRNYYNQKIKAEWRDVFFGKLDIIKNDFTDSVKLSVSQVFSDINNEYGLLCSLILDDDNGVISEKNQEAVKKINIANLPVYCSDIIYYLLKWQYPLYKILVNFKEVWVSCIFEYIAKQHDDLCEKIYDYLQQNEEQNKINEYKLSKELCRYVLLLDKVDAVKYNYIFDRYMQAGAAYLKAVYTRDVIDNVMVCEVKNDEEVFLLYMLHAQINKQENKEEYVNCLRNALQAFPGMKKGIEMLLAEMQGVKNINDSEFEEYKKQVKNTIKQLIDSGKMDEAKTILREYKSIVSDDMEAILLESKILLN